MIFPVDLLVDPVHERVQVAEQRLVPEPGVDEERPLVVEHRLEVVLVDRADELLELLVRGEDDLGRRHLVEVAHLEPDDAVLDVVHDPHAVARADLARALQQLHQAEPLAVQRPPAGRARTRSPRPPARRARRCGRVTSSKTSSRGGSSRSSIGPPSDERPQRLSSIEYGSVSAAALHRDAVLARVLDLLLAAHLPAAHRRDDLQLGRERHDRGLDPHLVVALAGAAVGDRVAARLARLLHRDLRDQRPAERGEERVAAAVEGVGLDRRQHVVVGELLARVDHVALERAQVEGLLAHHVEVLAGLAQVHGERDHLGLVLVLDPLEHHARVEAARVEQQHAADLAGQRLVRGGLGQRAAFDLGHWAGEASGRPAERYLTTVIG